MKTGRSSELRVKWRRTWMIIIWYSLSFQGADNSKEMGLRRRRNKLRFRSTKWLFNAQNQEAKKWWLPWPGCLASKPRHPNSQDSTISTTTEAIGICNLLNLLLPMSEIIIDIMIMLVNYFLKYKFYFANRVASIIFDLLYLIASKTNEGGPLNRKIGKIWKWPDIFWKWEKSGNQTEFIFCLGIWLIPSFFF